MKPLTIDDLLPLAEFAARRTELFAAHARYLDRYRRVRVGPRLTLVFENRQTLWFRIQDLLRVARLADPHRVRHELEWYNRLLPGGEALQATLLIEVEDASRMAEEFDFWADLTGEHLRLWADGGSAAADLVTCRPEDRCAGTAHWVRFAIPRTIQSALADPRRPAWFAADYRDYQYRSAPLSDPVRQSLLGDLDPSDRGRAA